MLLLAGCDNSIYPRLQDVPERTHPPLTQQQAQTEIKELKQANQALRV